MEVAIKEIIKQDWSKDMETLFGQMEVDMMVNSIKIILMDLDIINGLMEGNMKVNGDKIKWMEKVFLSGLMVENMKETMWMIKKKDMDNSPGLMGDVIRGFGRMENKMAKGFTKTSKTVKEKESGRMVKKLSGRLDMINFRFYFHIKYCSICNLFIKDWIKMQSRAAKLASLIEKVLPLLWSSNQSSKVSKGIISK